MDMLGAGRGQLEGHVPGQTDRSWAKTGRQTATHTCTGGGQMGVGRTDWARLMDEWRETNGQMEEHAPGTDGQIEGCILRMDGRMGCILRKERGRRMPQGLTEKRGTPRGCRIRGVIPMG